MRERRVTVSDLALLALRMSESPCRRLCGAERAELSHEFLADFLAATGDNGAVAFPRALAQSTLFCTVDAPLTPIAPTISLSTLFPVLQNHLVEMAGDIRRPVCSFQCLHS